MHVDVHELKVQFARYLEMALRGETVVICKEGIPVAELRAVSARRSEPRPLGIARGELEVPPSFFEPLPDDVLLGFSGEP